MEQNELYQSILDKDIRAFLENKHLSRASSGTVTPRKRKSESPDEFELEMTSAVSTPRTRSGMSTPAMSRSSSMRSMRKKQRTSYREMTDSEWYSAMENAEKEQFKYDYSPSPEVTKLHSSNRITPLPLLFSTPWSGLFVESRQILGQFESTEHDNATP